MDIHSHYFYFSSIFFIFVLTGCNLIPSATPTAVSIATISPVATFPPIKTPSIEFTRIPSTTPVPVLQPGEPPKSLRLLQDNNSSPYAKIKSISSGDNPLNNLYERPFSAEEMIYQPEIDIQSAEIAQDNNFFYFTITLEGIDIGHQSLSGIYGIEFDHSLTGRGDLLVIAENPEANWSITPIKIFIDQNNDVGGPNPIIADRGFNGDGYETTLTMNQDQVAYARLKPSQPNAVQIAISRKLFSSNEKFLWGAWAYKQNINPGWFDLDDHFGRSEAGSPIKTSSDYPLKALHSLDNTCRLNFGFFPLGLIPGMCISGPQASHPGEACTCTRPDLLSGACYAWYCK